MSLFTLVVHLLLSISSHATLPPLPIDENINATKPWPNDLELEVRRKCERLAVESRSRRIGLLLIGIEGQDGFSPTNTLLVYRYLWQLQNGQPTSPPLLDNSAPVLHRLLLPLVTRYSGQIEILSFPEFAMSGNENNAPIICAATWYSLVNHPRIVLLGHSFGGDAIHELAEGLSSKEIPVEKAYSIDAVGKSAAKRFYKPPNVGLWTNFFQRNEPPFGSWIYRSPANHDLSRYGVNHRTIVRSQPVISTIIEQLEMP